MSDVRQALAKEEAEALQSSNQLYPHEISPSAFVNQGLQLEEQQ